MAEQEWPKRMNLKPNLQQPVCILCRKPIQVGELYHYLTRKGRKFLHTECYEKEMVRHD